MSSYGNIIRDGLWNNNPATVQVLGLCPLLAVTSTVVNSLGLGIATTIVLILTNVTISLIRKLVRPEIRMPVFVLVIAAAVTIAQLIIQAYFYQLYLIIGLYVALITTNCVIMARAEAFASKNTVFASALDGLFMGLGGTIVLVALGAMREVIGYGTLFQQFDLLFGHAAKAMEITVIHHYHGFLLAILPPGAFIGLGLLIALKNIIDARREQAQVLAGTQTAT